MLINPTKAIIPIVRINDEGLIDKLLGTGFFVHGGRKTVVTAKHVFFDNPLNEGESYGIVIPGDENKVNLGKIESYVSSDTYDIAAFEACIPSAVYLKLKSTQMPVNEDVITCEFSSTRFIKNGKNKITVEFIPLVHKGNIMCYYLSNFPEKIPAPSFDVSFPALQGASGAPVIRNTDKAVVGMLVANHERHLIPAQIVKEEGENIETHYFMPTGKAIESVLIINYLKELGANPYVIKD